MNLLREELGFATQGAPVPAQGHARVDLLADRERRGEAGRRAEAPLPVVHRRSDGIRQVFQAYTGRKREQNVLDYDDLLLFWKALATSPQTREQLAAMFDHVLVDEYQDTNALQADILEGMRPADTARNITVVGDDAQSIYGFRAATVRNILEFPTRFEGATVIRLEQNYRSITPILDATNAAIALSPQRHEKTLWSAREGRADAGAPDVPGRSGAVRLRVPERVAASRGGRGAQAAGRAVPRGASLGSPRGRAGPAQHPVREVRRVEVPGGRACEGRAVAASRVGEPVRRGELVPRAPAAGRGRAGHRPPADGRARRPPHRRRSAVAAAAVPGGAGRRAQGSGERRAGAARSARRLSRGRAPHAAGRAARSPPRVPRAGLRAPLRRGRVAHA